jgi:hypothetical protein
MSFPMLSVRILLEPDVLSKRLSVTLQEEAAMGRGILLWLLGVPIPIIILVLLLWHH